MSKKLNYILCIVGLAVALAVGGVMTSWGSYAKVAGRAVDQQVADLSPREYQRVKSYINGDFFARPPWSDLSKDWIRDLSKASVVRVSNNDVELYKNLLNEYQENPNLWAPLIGISIQRINSGDSGSGFLLQELRAVTGKPEIDELDIKKFIDDKNLDLIAALILSYSSQELKKFSEELRSLQANGSLPKRLNRAIEDKLSN